jgi:hypothetical protein
VIHAVTTELLRANILSLASEFILELLSSVVENLKEFQRNLDVRSLNTRHKYDFPGPQSNLSRYAKAVNGTATKLFDNLPTTTENLNYYIKALKPTLKAYLVSHCYSVYEFT